jgi:arginine/ornithine N-succinyltransferase beta subunit
MAINRNRELSQIASVVIVDDASKNVGIATTSAPKVGIGLTDPSYKLDVVGAINSSNDVKVNGTSVLTSAQNDAVALAIALG